MSTPPWRPRRGLWFNGHRILYGYINGEKIPLAFIADAWTIDNLSLKTASVIQAVVSSVLRPWHVETVQLKSGSLDYASLVVILKPSAINNIELNAAIQNYGSLTVIVKSNVEQDTVHLETSATTYGVLVTEIGAEAKGDSFSFETSATTQATLANVADRVVTDTHGFQMYSRCGATNRDWILPYTDNDGYLVIQQAWRPTVTDGYLTME